MNNTDTNDSTQMRCIGKWWGRCSVLIDENSELYKHITAIQMKICDKYNMQMTFINDRPLHVEICNKFANEDTRKKAFDELMKCTIDVTNADNYVMIAKAFVLNIGVISDANRHITIAFGLRKPLDELRQFV
jgi:hypothetical protein